MDTDDRQWIETVLSQTPGYERAVFDRFAQRLMAFAQSRLPVAVSQRVDEEDIVQSVFISFFRRYEAGEFVFDGAPDMWTLLAAMTYRKVASAIKFHQRERRAARRETGPGDGTGAGLSQLLDREPGPEELGIMCDSMRWLLEQLASAQREILQARLEGMTVAEIAERVGVSQSTVKRTLAKTRQLATRRLEQDD